MLGVVPYIFIFLLRDEYGAVFLLLWLKEGVLFLEELLQFYEGVGKNARA